MEWTREATLIKRKRKRYGGGKDERRKRKRKREKEGGERGRENMVDGDLLAIIIVSVIHSSLGPEDGAGVGVLTWIVPLKTSALINPLTPSTASLVCLYCMCYAAGRT